MTFESYLSASAQSLLEGEGFAAHLPVLVTSFNHHALLSMSHVFECPEEATEYLQTEATRFASAADQRRQWDMACNNWVTANPPPENRQMCTHCSVSLLCSGICGSTVQNTARRRQWLSDFQTARLRLKSGIGFDPSAVPSTTDWLHYDASSVYAANPAVASQDVAEAHTAEWSKAYDDIETICLRNQTSHRSH